MNALSVTENVNMKKTGLGTNVSECRTIGAGLL